MATEYYIIKPNKKQIFYLGKRINYLDGIPSYRFAQAAGYCVWENYHDTFLDIYENDLYFFEQDMTMAQAHAFANAIYEFCDDKVYLDNDCSENCNVWKDYTETDVFEEIFAEPNEERGEI